MCVSAEVSFGASAVLAAGGIWARSLAAKPEERPIASLPLLFGVQQFFEGVIWIGLTQDQPELVSVFSYLYSFFALLLWPVLVPIAAFRVEPGAGRRRIQEALWVVGVCVAILVSGSLARHGVTTQLVDGHIAYRVDLPHLFEWVGLYLLAVSSPCFSSHRYLRCFGGLLIVGLAASLARYSLEFVSVWCLFAAAASLVVVAHLRAVRSHDGPPGPKEA